MVESTDLVPGRRRGAPVDSRAGRAALRPRQLVRVMEDSPLRTCTGQATLWAPPVNRHPTILPVVMNESI